MEQETAPRILAVVPAVESVNLPAKSLVGEAGDGVDDEAERTGQGHGVLIPQAQGSGLLTVGHEKPDRAARSHMDRRLTR
jgi:hypothetical protein